MLVAFERKLNLVPFFGCLENLSASKAENVTPAQDVQAFFKLADSSLSITAGKVLGVWRRQSEKVSVGVERWNIAPSTFSKPKYIYVAEVIVSKYPLATKDAKVEAGGS